MDDELIDDEGPVDESVRDSPGSDRGDSILSRVWIWSGDPPMPVTPVGSPVIIEELNPDESSEIPVHENEMIPSVSDAISRRSRR